MERTARLLTILLLSAFPLRADEVDRAAALVNQGRYAEAARLYETLAAKDPGNATLHQSLGLCQQALGDYLRAAASLEQAVNLATDPSVPAYSLALTHEALARGPERAKRLALALEAWRTVVSRGSGEPARTAARHIEWIQDELAGRR